MARCPRSGMGTSAWGATITRLSAAVEARLGVPIGCEFCRCTSTTHCRVRRCHSRSLSLTGHELRCGESTLIDAATAQPRTAAARATQTAVPRTRWSAAMPGNATAPRPAQDMTRWLLNGSSLHRTWSYTAAHAPRRPPRVANPITTSAPSTASSTAAPAKRKTPANSSEDCGLRADTSASLRHGGTHSNASARFTVTGTPLAAGRWTKLCGGETRKSEISQPQVRHAKRDR